MTKAAVAAAAAASLAAAAAAADRRVAFFEVNPRPRSRSQFDPQFSSPSHGFGAILYAGIEGEGGEKGGGGAGIENDAIGGFGIVEEEEDDDEGGGEVRAAIRRVALHRDAGDGAPVTARREVTPSSVRSSVTGAAA